MAIYQSNTQGGSASGGEYVYNPTAWLDREKEAYAKEMKKKGFVWKDGKWVKPGKPDLPGEDKKKQQPAQQGGGGGGGYYGGGYGGGSSAATNTGQTYIEEYRIRFYPKGNPPKDLLERAKKNNWSVAYFDLQVRLQDPKYLGSVEAKSQLPAFNKTMQVLFPGLADKTKQAQLMKSKFYRQTATWYLKNGVGLQPGGEELLYNHITNTKLWNQNNPYWKDYAKNANPTVVAERNPLLYKTYLDEMRNQFTQAGINDLPEDYYRTFFQSRYASQSGLKDLADNLKSYMQTSGSQAWWQGSPVTKAQTKTATLDADRTGVDLRTRMAQNFGVESSFRSGQQQGFQTSLSKRGQLVNPNL